MADDELIAWLGDELAGRFLRSRDGLVTFEYDPAYVRAVDATPLSASMPLSASEHAASVVGPWLSNLLPDNERVLERWAAEFGARDISAFELLRHMGADCPGALQILQPDVAPDPSRGGMPQSDAQIAARIRSLREDASSWNAPDGTDDAREFGRFSLAGAQGKFALTRVVGGWQLPVGHSASTHIFKVGVQRIDDLDVAEYVTTAAARALGLPVVEQELRDFDGERVLVSRRYDRYVERDRVHRIHQEDFCQALGVWPRNRYEKDAGGPTLADLVGVVDTYVSAGTYRSRSREMLAQATAFNLLSLGTDAHAKNHSLLHVGPETTMAPLYDLGSAAFAYDRPQLADAVMAVRYGTTRRVAHIDGAQILRVADVLGVDRDAYRATVLGFAASVPDAIADAMRASPFLPGDNPRFADAPAVLSELAARIVSDLDRVRDADVPHFAGARRH